VLFTWHVEVYGEVTTNLHTAAAAAAAAVVVVSYCY
jgi:hypothetical protein